MENQTKAKLDAGQKALICGKTALDKKAENLKILDVRGISSFSDYFVICSGHSTRHVQGIVRAIEESLNQFKIHPRGVEGLEQGHWVLMDYDEVIVHVFYNPIREFYDLEDLWSEAKVIEITET